MRISKVFSLKKSQWELDFIDIDPNQDLMLFIDPYFLSAQNDPWSEESCEVIRNFFQHLLDLIKGKVYSEASLLLSHLDEPNETCLGMSKGRPRGRGVGKHKSKDIYDSIIKSKAAKSGLLSDIEDCVLFVDGIGKDMLSDMTTNIIKKKLIEYTQTQCRLWGFPMRTLPSGWFWDAEHQIWKSEITEMLVVKGRKILLVPKAIVSRGEIYTPQKYHSKYLLEFLQHEHLRMQSVLVHKRKKGADYVTKKSIVAYDDVP